MRIIYRDFNRSEEDDFKLNVSPYLGNTLEAVPLYSLTAEPVSRQKILIGWKIQLRYE